MIILPFVPIRREDDDDDDDVEDEIEYVPVVDAILDPSTYAVSLVVEIEPEYVNAM